MSITLNITPPVTDALIDEAIITLKRLRHVGESHHNTDPKMADPLLSTVEEIESNHSQDGTGGMTVQTFDRNGVELDADGLPWDERIHSKNGTMNADGRWKKKRGVDDDTYNAVVAELRGEAPEGTSEPETHVTPPAPAPAAPPAPAPDPAPAPAVTRYKHGDATFTRDELLQAGWNDSQIAGLEVVSAEPEAPANPPAPAADMTFAEVAQRINADGLDINDVNAHVAEVAAAAGAPQVANFALLAVPAHAEILAGLVTKLWPEG